MISSYKTIVFTIVVVVVFFVSFSLTDMYLCNNVDQRVIMYELEYVYLSLNFLFTIDDEQYKTYVLVIPCDATKQQQRNYFYIYVCHA